MDIGSASRTLMKLAVLTLVVYHRIQRLNAKESAKWRTSCGQSPNTTVLALTELVLINMISWQKSTPTDLWRFHSQFMRLTKCLCLLNRINNTYQYHRRQRLLNILFLHLVLFLTFKIRIQYCLNSKRC